MVSSRDLLYPSNDRFCLWIGSGEAGLAVVDRQRPWYMEPMTLHVLKLCVGCDAVEDLAAWQHQRLEMLRQSDSSAELLHVTRQTPRRAGFAPGASSIYWVMGGFIRARQRIVALREVRGADGIMRCGLALDLKLIVTEPVPRRPFQGWRYFPDSETPPDLDPNAPKYESAIPPAMRAALAELRLI